MINRVNIQRSTLLACAWVLLSTSLSLSLTPGFWPSAPERLWGATACGGVTATIAAAWIASRNPLPYYTAIAGFPRALARIILPVLLTHGIAFILIMLIVAWRILPAAGTPPWWMAGMAPAWVIAGTSLGAGIGVLFARKTILALSTALTFSCGIAAASLIQPNVPFLPRLIFSWGATPRMVWIRPAIGPYLTPILACAVAALAVFLMIRFSIAQQPRGITKLLYMGGIPLVALVVISGGSYASSADNAQFTGRSQPQTLVCTRDAHGTSLCTWTESTMWAEKVDSVWDKLTRYWVDIGAPAPRGTIRTDGITSTNPAAPQQISPLHLEEVRERRNVVINLTKETIAYTLEQRCGAPINPTWVPDNRAAITAQYLFAPEMTTELPYAVDQYKDVYQWIEDTTGSSDRSTQNYSALTTALQKELTSVDCAQLTNFSSPEPTSESSVDDNPGDA